MCVLFNYVLFIYDLNLLFTRTMKIIVKVIIIDVCVLFTI